MRPPILNPLFADAETLPGVGKRLKPLISRLVSDREGGALVKDVLFHLPVGLIDRRAMPDLMTAPDGEVITAIVEVEEYIEPRPRTKQPHKIVCRNETGYLTIVYFHANLNYLMRELPVGKKRVVSGRVERFDGQLQMAHPDLILPPEQLEKALRAEPVYPLTAGITSRTLGKILAAALGKTPELKEWLHVHIPPPLAGGVGGGVHTTRNTHAQAKAHELRHTLTNAEARLWNIVKSRQLDGYHFRKQQPIGPYIADFVSNQKKLIIELDGGQHATQQSYDAVRTAFMEKAGYTVIRFWNNEVIENPEGVTETILKKLQELPDATTPPPPPPASGGGENYPQGGSLSSWKQALLAAHHPQTQEDVDPASPARSRLAYDELLANQLALALTRGLVKQKPGRVLKGNGRLRKKLQDSLPFAFTRGQEEVLNEILADAASGRRMLRLLQGDVGSGKTVVALMAMLNAAEAGAQSALMAPTEILARQHFEKISAMLDAAGLQEVGIVILTGREKGKQRQEILDQLASGEAKIAIGTHALFQEGVQFGDLALAVIDEQHRFGVRQRMALSRKGKGTDILLLTATPIPRTLALTFYGDMEVSSLKEKPAGRQPIATRVMPLARELEVIEGLKRAVSKGNRIYWVCPLIDGAEEGSADEFSAAEARYAGLKSIFGNRIGLVHGRMKGEEKDKVMLAFKEGKLDILVATTVIEVGVDVPEATIMIVEHAERFGLSTLHQLRGRVGRGSAQSSCVLLYGDALSETGVRRLSILRETEDGFRIAEEDLVLRGSGEVLGTKQSGMVQFRFAQFPEHGQLLLAARDDVKHIIDTDPKLASPRGEALKTLLYLFEYDAQVKYLEGG